MKSILLIGVNRFGSWLAREFYNQGHQVMAIDRHEDRINKVMEFVTGAQIGDSTNEALLRSLGIPDYDICIVTIAKDFQSSLETTSLLKQLGGRLVIARADHDVQEKFLLRNGADEVINPEKQIAQWAAIRYASNQILDYIKLDEDHAIFEVPIPNEWQGKSIGRINIRKKYGINIMALKENGRTDLSITPDTILREGCTMLILGEHRLIRKVFHI